MSGADINPLAIIAPDLYAKQLAIQQRQAMAQALLQNGQDPGKGGYGGLRSAGSSILGAILAKKSMQDMAELYSPQQPTWGQPQQDQQAAQSPQAQTPETQISNNPGSGPVMAPQTAPNASIAPSQTSPAQAMGQALQGPQGQSQGAPQQIPNQVQAGQTISPQMQQILQQRYGTSEPQQWQAPRTIPNVMGQAITPLPGMSQQQSMLEFMGNNTGYWKALNDANALTDTQKQIAAAFPNDPSSQIKMLQAQSAKSGAIDLRDMGGAAVPMPGGGYSRIYGPNENSNVYYSTGPNGEPIAHTIVGGSEAAASTAGQIEAAKEQNKVIEVTLSDGRVVPMRAGDVVPYGSKTPVTPPPPRGTPQAANSGPLPIPAQNPAIAAQVDATRPAPIGIGQSAAQAKVNQATGDAAVANAHVQATTQATLKAIDGLIALNDKVPDSTGISPDWKADINRRVPGVFSGDAGALAQWNQLNGIGVLGGLKQLQGLGRLDLPEVNQVVKTNGVPADVPRTQRLQILQNLKTMIQNNLGVSQTNVANLNKPDITSSTQTVPMQNYGSPSAQDIVDELRRRGKVK